MNAVERIRGGLVVSVQAYPGEPMRHPDTMRRVAESAVRGGASGIRAQGIDDLRAMRPVIDLPLVGLWKDGDSGVFITPTVIHAVEVARTGCEIVAVDGTRRPRPDGSSLAESVAAVHREGALIMADCATLADGLAAAEAGADIIGTTLSGYTEDSPKTPGPDLDLVAALVRELGLPVVAEGRIHTPDQARAALDAGAHAVVVGTAITHPATITSWFVEATRVHA
ncbi:N-acetylmannosamine-6-phosphate 2-epimerase [Intrasporangium calvum]|uniref:Putative N-acetylmannosamine-6-phosphate 2-epimerase n=1 Tax=Intrasporangium calvum TaxID=53358 RepID=A0ABT5GID2_9MICO|nr:N-acetylmannosamine-6-phosphate 2-epimerase [Intrasporangium calvum]MDC5698008.1 N-acetylmannosamine-6-phosphate 2-epimerase [Intrasporangium calvum]